MNVQELIDILSDLDPNAEVLIATQPSWPLQFNLHGVFDASQADLPCEDHGAYECSECDSDATEPPAVYLATGDHPQDRGPYAPKVWGELIYA